MTLPASVLALVYAAAAEVNINRKQLDRQAYQVLNEGGDEAVELFAAMIDRSVSYVRDRARCYELRELLKAEFPQYKEWDAKVQDTVFLEVAKSLALERIDVPGAVEVLEHCYEAACEGQRLRVEEVKQLLPHPDPEDSFVSRGLRIIVGMRSWLNSPSLGIEQKEYTRLHRLVGLMERALQKCQEATK